MSSEDRKPDSAESGAAGSGAAEPATEGTPAAGPSEKRAKAAPNPPSRNILSRPSDFVARPGFRNPPNRRSKASRRRKKRR